MAISSGSQMGYWLPASVTACAYDLLTDRVHLLAPAAGRLLARLPTDRRSLLESAHDIPDHGDPDPSDEFDRGIAALTALGILNRSHTYLAPMPVSGSTREPHGDYTGTSHHVLDQILAFRSTDQLLLDDIDRFMGVGTRDTPPTVLFDVEPRADGGVDLYASEHWAFPDIPSFFVQLPGAVHDFAPRSCSQIVFHAGAVRTPDRRVLLLPGGTEHGKSTLVAALVQAGCDYLGDEMTGVLAESLNCLCYPAPLALDNNGRQVLGLGPSRSPHTDPRELNGEVVLLSGEVEPVNEVILPVFNLEAEPLVEQLTPIDALRALLENTTNLHLAGELGFETLCAIAESVVVTRIVHGDTRKIAQSILSGHPIG